MPTHVETSRFLREYDRLSLELQRRFRVALGIFIADLLAMEEGLVRWFDFRPGLRVKKVQGAQDLYEMTWAPDGRALFRIEEEILTGKLHVVWERIGTHSILP